MLGFKDHSGNQNCCFGITLGQGLHVNRHSYAIMGWQWDTGHAELRVSKPAADSTGTELVVNRHAHSDERWHWGQNTHVNLCDHSAVDLCRNMAHV